MVIQCFFFCRKKIHQECAEAGILKNTGDVAVARAVATAAAPMSKEDRSTSARGDREVALSARGDREVAFEHDSIDWNMERHFMNLSVSSHC